MNEMTKTSPKAHPPLAENDEKYCMLEIQQQKHPEWAWQWEHYRDDEEWLFKDWIAPNTFEDFRNKRVLDAGCGGGQHLDMVAPYAAEVVGVDLNAAHVAAKRNERHPNVRTMNGDIANVSFDAQFDVVYCVGVIHHTDDPDATFRNLAMLTKPGGKTIVWAYSHEGNFLNRVFVEWAKALLVSRLPKPAMRALSLLLTILLYVPVYTVYLLPLRFLPYYEYFQNFRKLGYSRNELNVFDKLNAPQTHFITQDRITRWFRDNGYRDVHISPYRGVSWRGSGIKN